MKKKKGSSLVLVLLIMAALMTIGTTSLTTINMNVKMRIEENKRIQSLYGAEAGLDFAQNLIEKTFNMATRYAEQEAQNSIKGIEINDENYEEVMNQLNKTFKDSFKKFIEVSGDSETNEFFKAIEGSEYINSLDKSEKVKLQFSTFTDKVPNFSIVGKSEPQNDKYEFDLISNFESVKDGINNERELKVSYEIEIPDYQGRYVSNSVEVNSLFYNRPLVIDGDLNIDGGHVNFMGDVFVGGNNYPLSNPTYDKYKGGVRITNSTVNFSSNLYTKKTLTVENNAKISVANNFYGANLYVGNTSGSHSENGHIRINQAAILDNDLALNSKNSTIEVNDYYGLNDKTYNSDTVTRTSSSILVNGNENSLLKIKNSAYIMGVAYINTLGEKYQTGESIAVKGNYMAYTQPLPNSQYSDVEFKYYEPLYLVDKQNNDLLSAIEKSEYFKEFYSTPLGSADSGGVELPADSMGKVQNVYATGAIVYKTKNNQTIVESSTYNQSIDEQIRQKREDYATYVYDMNVKSMNHNDIDRLTVYNSLGTLGKTVSSVVNFNTIQLNCDSGEVNCNSQNLKMISSPSNIVLGSNSGNYDGNYIKFNEDPSRIEAIIIVNGDVIIDGNLDFTGTIIATGDIRIEGGGEVKLKYDPVTVAEIIAQNNAAFTNIFNDVKTDTQYVNGFESYNSGQYDPSKYIKSYSWKIMN